MKRLTELLSNRGGRSSEGRAAAASSLIQYATEVLPSASSNQAKYMETSVRKTESLLAQTQAIIN